MARRKNILVEKKLALLENETKFYVESFKEGTDLLFRIMNYGI